MTATATCAATPACARSARPCRWSRSTEAVLVARYGGEEFALLLPGLDIEQAVALAEEARRAIEDLLIDARRCRLAASSPSVSASSAMVPGLANQPPAWSRRPIARSTPLNAAAATPWSRTRPCS